MSVLDVLHLVWACLEEMSSLNIFDPLFMINEINFNLKYWERFMWFIS